MTLDSRIQSGMSRMGFSKLTDIQNKVYEPALENKNIIACSGTGTGKTLAFLIPTIVRNADNNSLYAIIMAPSKELSMQICSQINAISNASGIVVRAVALFGGVNSRRQIESLKKNKPHIVVGTCDRIYELIKEKRLSVHTVNTFIIDEADRLLNPDKYELVGSLRKCCMRDIQIMAFSASINDKTIEYAKQLTNGEFVNILTKEKISIPSNIKNIYFIVPKKDKIEMVRKVIRAIGTKHCLIFTNSAYDADEITQKLLYHKYNVAMLNSKVDKAKRKNIIDAFRKEATDFLVCSDMAARGMDFKNVNAVINIDISDNPTEYLHRAGRCGRDGLDAICASIITDGQVNIIRKIQKTFNVNIIERHLYKGSIVK